MKKVYLSSTYDDLIEYRRSAIQQMRKLGLEVVGMEENVAEELRSLDRCFKDIRSCDLYVGIFAWRYGTCPVEHSTSFTELEYREAGNKGLDRLIFLLSDECPWPPSKTDAHVFGDGKAITKLRDELEQTHLCTHFSSPDDLASKLSAAIQKFIGERSGFAPSFHDGMPLERWSISQHAKTIISNFGNALDSLHVPLAATLQGAGVEGLDTCDERLLPPSFEIVDRRLRRSSAPNAVFEAAEDAMAKGGRLVVLGGPGAGKTHYLRLMELAAARVLLDNPDAPIPLYIPLTQWPAGIVDMDSLIVHWRTVNALQAVPNRRLFLLFDELNEIDGPTYSVKISAIERWMQTNPKAPVVLASRLRHYESNLQLPASKLILHPMDGQRVETFIRNYLGVRAEELLTELIWEPHGKIAARRLSLLSQNPYLLRLLCYVFELSGSATPLTKGQLLRSLVESLYDREHQKAWSWNIDLDSMINGAGKLALAMIQTRSSTSIHRSFALKHLGKNALIASRILNLLRECSLIHLVKNDQLVQFSHQMLLEYFAAERLAMCPDDLTSALEKPRIDHGKRSLSQMDEVVQTIIDLAPPADTLRRVIAVDPFFAAQLVGGSDNPVSLLGELHGTLVKALATALENRTTQEAAVQALALLGDSGVNALSSLLTHEHKWVRRSSVRALGEIGTPAAVTELVHALLDSDKWIRRDTIDFFRSTDVPRQAIEEYVRTALSNLEGEDRAFMGRQLLLAFNLPDDPLRQMIVEHCNFDKDTVIHPQSSRPADSLSMELRLFLKQCSTAFHRGLTIPYAGYVLIKFLKAKNMPEDVLVNLHSVSINWLRLNIGHSMFSSIFALAAEKPDLNAADRNALLLILADRLDMVPPGVHGIGRRSKAVIHLLGDIHEIPFQTLKRLAAAVVQNISFFQLKVLNTEALRFLADILPGSNDLAKALLTRADFEEDYFRRYSIFLDSEYVPIEPKGVRKYVDECFFAVQELLAKEHITKFYSEVDQIVARVENLAEAGNIYACRHVVARLTLLSLRSRDDHLQRRILALIDKGATNSNLTKSQRKLFGNAFYKLVEKGLFGESDTAEQALIYFGIRRFDFDPV